MQTTTRAPRTRAEMQAEIERLTRAMRRTAAELDRLRAATETATERTRRYIESPQIQ